MKKDQKKEQLLINNRVLLFSLFSLFFVICSLLFVSCFNPLMKDVLGAREIYFNTNGGNPVPDKQLPWRNETINLPIDPTKNGYVFAGWYTDNDTFNNLWDFNEKEFDDMTLFAKWNSADGTACGECGEEPCVCVNSITLSGNLNFGYEVTGYAAQPPREVIVTNTGNLPTGPMTITLTGASSSSFALSTTSLSSLDPGENSNFEVIVNDNLGAGTYNAVVTVSNGTNISENINVSFVVTKAPVVGISVIQQPTKMIYVHGDPLVLTGLMVRINYDDSTFEDVPFTSYGISTTPTNGTVLSRATHHNTTVTVHLGSFSANTGTLTVNKAPGAAVGIPAFSSNTTDPITITVNTITAPNNGQSVEYNISTASDGTGLGTWQISTTFDGILENTSYFVYARSAENDNFYAGGLSVSTPQIILYRVTFNTNGGSPVPADQIIISNGRITAPADPTRTDHGFAGWYNNAAFTGSVWNFANNPVTGQMTLYARWIPNTAGITLTVNQIVNNAPSPADNIILSRTGTGYDQTQLIYINPAPFDTGSIKWEISGVGYYSDHTVTGFDSSFTLEATNVIYNSIGGHTLRLTVSIGGVEYMRNINFTINP